MTSEWLTIEEFAREARIGVRTAHRYIATGVVKASKPGRRLLIQAAEVEKLMKRTQRVVS